MRHILGQTQQTCAAVWSQDSSRVLNIIGILTQIDRCGQILLRLHLSVISFAYYRFSRLFLVNLLQILLCQGSIHFMLWSREHLKLILQILGCRLLGKLILEGRKFCKVPHRSRLLHLIMLSWEWNNLLRITVACWWKIWGLPLSRRWFLLVDRWWKFGGIVSLTILCLAI